MSDTIIRVENLGKKYIIGHQRETSSRYVALRDVIADTAKSLWQRIQNPKAKIQNNSEEFWALKDVSFEIKQGEAVGIIGRNGAGKSTLLKILSRITEPTTGRISIKGRVASLLEVGTGFHPELTGRENIYLNGAILGMSKVEIKRKFDEIVAFAEVEKFLDTPVKRYSSGMYVRLAFAVAAHLEPEILVVDEVLAVGDAAFQKKCLGKMGDVKTKEGRTVFFVSHNMGAISQLTDRCLLLDKGKIVGNGLTHAIVLKYLEYNQGYFAENQNIYFKKKEDYIPTRPIEFCQIKLDRVNSNQLECQLIYLVRESLQSVVAVKITNSQEITVTTLRDTDDNSNSFFKQKGLYLNQFYIDTTSWSPDRYFMTFSLADMVSKRYEFLENALSFEIYINEQDATPGWTREGLILQKTKWKNCLLDKAEIYQELNIL